MLGVDILMIFVILGTQDKKFPRLLEAIQKKIDEGKISKKEILEKCPDISKKTVERALADLVKESLIEKVGASSATAYVWIQK